MIRKLFLFATLLLSLSSVSAQTVGEWKIWTQFNGVINDLVESPSKVYYTSSNRLFSYDKDSNETYIYTTNNKLSDTDVSFVSYNPDNKYLFINYSNGNIDLLYENGRVVNISDIKDAALTYTRKINNVVFANDRIYLATTFGLVVIDDKKHEVVESGIFGVSIDAVVPVGDFLMIARDGYGFLYSPLNGRHNTLDKFTRVNNLGYNARWADVVNNNIVFKNRNTDILQIATVENENGIPNVAIQSTDDKPTTSLKKSSSKNYLMTSNHIIFVNEDGSIEKVALPEALINQNIALDKGITSVWAADADGLANYSIADGQLTVLSDKYKPEGIYTDQVMFIHFDKWGNLWTGNQGPTQYRGTQGDHYELMQATTRIVNGVPEDVNPLIDNPASNEVLQWQIALNTKRMFSCGNFAPDPEIPDRYYQGYNTDGLYIIEKNPETGAWEEIGRFTMFNSPFYGPYGLIARALEVQFDRENNLWAAIQGSGGMANTSVFMLPREVLLNKDPKDIVYDDWKLTDRDLSFRQGNKDHRLLICDKSDVIFDYYGGWGAPLVVNKHKGTFTKMEDDEIFALVDPTDQDGKVWNPTYITCAIEDKRGRVWVGCESQGIIEIANPNNLTPLSTVTRLKVPRNDGTNYADYLCDAEYVLDMAVDSSNRKWIATKTSGVYLVSENGDEIIEHFTTANSPLPTNEVYTVACDPNSNTVYFGLPTGLVSYNSTSSPSAEDYSQVYAYPNPVRPDYTGYITITGLMDNSLVKITDAGGGVVFQTRSEGGMAIWDGLDHNHNRVKTGVYYVLASQNADGGKESVVTKIMVVR